MGHHEQIPAVIEILPGIADQMPVAAILGRQQVAGPGIVPAGSEGAADNAGEFTGDKHSHLAAPRSGRVCEGASLDVSAWSCFQSGGSFAPSVAGAWERAVNVSRPTP